MSAIIKTLPTRFARGHLERFFSMRERCKYPESFRFYFTLGRGKPSRPVEEIYFTHRGRILGHFEIEEIVQNVGQLPKLTTMDGEPSEWQIKPDRWVAVCKALFVPFDETLFYGGFQGWHYFDLAKYRTSIDAKVKV